jgi:hypothetical protein
MTRRTLLVLAALIAPRFAAAEQAPSAPVAEGRVFEMRTYYAAPGKIDALNARFRDHTLALFKKHGLEVVGFWMPIDKDKDPAAGDKLVYILSFKSRAAAEASWKAFVADPAWVAARNASEANGKLLTKIESVFLSGTDYSPLK